MRQNRTTGRRPDVIERLESRQLLSAAILRAVPSVESALLASPAGSASPIGYTPSQLRSAYGLNGVGFNGVTGDGSGQTIAIVVAYDNPKFVATGTSGYASSDLALFDKATGLPDPPSFKKVSEYGGSTNGMATNSSWAMETSLDVEMAHAIAPKANLLLVEASDDSVQQSGSSDLMNTAVRYAANYPGVSAVSVSFGTVEFSSESVYDSVFTTPSGHGGVTFVASSGDNRSLTYPAASPNVIGVGGTTLAVSGSNYSNESAWYGSGGGVSLYESKPWWQAAETQSSSRRLSPDVSFAGSTSAGVAVYDSFNNGNSTPWYALGGTSAATPAWAAIVAIANQGRAKLGLGSLAGNTQTLPNLYMLGTNNFHDVTTGSTNYSATAGFDLATGRGSPVANVLIPDLAGSASIGGTFFNDANKDGKYDSGDSSLGSGFGAFIDFNGDGVKDGIDFTTTSNSSGVYSFAGLPGGTYRVTPVTASGYTRTTPGSYYTITVGFGQSSTGQNIGLYKGTTTGGGGGSNSGAGSITGTVYKDSNQDGAWDNKESTIAGVTLYIDANKNGVKDGGEKSVSTDNSGHFAFTGLAAGTYRVREVVPTGYRQITPSSGYFDVTVSATGAVTVNFGDYK